LPDHLSKYFKKRKEKLIESWKERDRFEKYGIVGFVTAIISIVLFTPAKYSKDVSQLTNVACMVFMSMMINRLRKTKREVIAKNKEIELQKRLLEEKQKEIIDSITYAKRIQRSLLPTEKYIDRILNGKKKN